MHDPVLRMRFEETIMPHLAAAYNLARWLTGDQHDAEDVVQEAFLRAFHYFRRFQGEEGRTWLLAIVRNTCYRWLKRNRRPGGMASFDADLHGAAHEGLPTPERMLAASDARVALHEVLEELPVEYREALVLRELEGMSYKEITAVTGVPPGTVMSRLARGRGLLRDRLAVRLHEEL